MMTNLLCEAEMIGPGKYSGVVVFDRWDGCILYSGIHVMYVSERVKEGLRPYAGKGVQINATDVYQPMNPGDALIRKFEYLGPAPENKDRANLKGVRLESSVEVSPNGQPVANLIVINDANTPAKLFHHDLAPTLLMKRDTPGTAIWFVSDGPSFALITRQNLYNISPPLRGGQGSIGGKPFAWTINQGDELPRTGITLSPKDKIRVRLNLVLSDGEYDFLCGYGGYTPDVKCLASNLSAFDVKDAKATLVKVKGRQSERETQHNEER